MGTAANFLIGPFDDLRRFLVGGVASAPPTRRLDPAELEAARARLIRAGCNLSDCTRANLHTGFTSLPPKTVFNLAATWQLWPRSSFFACPYRDRNGHARFAYRWYKTIPIVQMSLKSAATPHHIIYDLVWGIGVGGYHSFLIHPPDANNGLTGFSIFTTFPPTPLFLEGLHDQMNRDIYQTLHQISTQDTPE